MIEKLAAQWHMDRAPRSGITRFSRVSGPVTLEGGPLLPDWTLEGPIKLQDEGASADGPVRIDFHAINPEEVVDHFMAGRIRFSWDSLEESLDEFMRHPKILHAHDPGLPVGLSDRPAVSPAGTDARGVIFDGPGLPEYWRSVARQGGADGSIGVDFQEADWISKEKVLQVNKAALIEWSLCGIPAMKSSFVRVAPLLAERADRTTASEKPVIPAEDPREVPAVDWDAVLGVEAHAFASLSRARVAIAAAGDAAGGGMGGGQ